jgi:hypothetical protein
MAFGPFAVLAVVVLIGASLRAEETDKLTVKLGQQSTVYPDGYCGIHFFPDEPISVLTTRPFRFLVVNGDSTFLMQGTSLTTAVAVKKVLEPGPKNSFDNGYAGILATVRSKQLGEYLCFYHAEDHIGMAEKLEGGTGFYASIALAVSKDGYSYAKVGQIITCSVPKGDFTTACAGVGDVSVCVDDSNKYLYAYFTDFSGVPKKKGCRISMARSLLAEGGRPGSWYKWSHNSFQEPGLKGEATPVVRGPTSFPCDAWAPYVTYLTSIKKYVMVFSVAAYEDWFKPTASRSGTYIAYSDDGIRWSEPQVVLITHCVLFQGKEVIEHPRLYLEKETEHYAKGWCSFTHIALALGRSQRGCHTTWCEDRSP